MDTFWQRSFTAEGRARVQAERDYEACSEARDALLLKFRRQASEEVSALIGPAHFLVDRHHTEFLAVSEDGKHIVGGDFGDEFVPSIDFLDLRSQSVTTHDIAIAVRRFQNRLRQNEIIAASVNSGSTNAPHAAALRKDGYRLSVYQSHRLRDLRIEHNDEPLSSTYAAASKILLDAIVRSPPLDDLNKLSSITLTIWLEGTNDWERDAFTFCLSYFDDIGHSDDSRREHRLSVCREIVPFVTRLTSHMGSGALNDHRLVRTGAENDDIAID